MVFMANLSLKLSHSSFELEQLHIKGGLLAAKGCYLLLDARVLCLLESVVALHLLFDFEVLVGQGLAYFLGFQTQNALERFFLSSQHCYFFLMVVKFFGQLLDHFFEGADFALDV